MWPPPVSDVSGRSSAANIAEDRREISSEIGGKIEPESTAESGSQSAGNRAQNPRHSKLAVWTPTTNYDLSGCASRYGRTYVYHQEFSTHWETFARLVSRIPLEHRLSVELDGADLGHLEWVTLSGRIATCWVDPAWRRRGLGRRMWQRAREYAAENGLALPTADGLPRSMPASAFIAAVADDDVMVGQVPLFPRPEGNRTEVVYQGSSSS